MTQLYGSGQVGAQIFGDGRAGLTFAEIRAQTGSGADGPGLAFNDWDSPTDDPREVVVQLVQPPASGSMKLYRNGAVALVGAADGVWPFTYRLRVDGAATALITSYFVVGQAALAMADAVLQPATVTGSAISVGRQVFGAAPFVALQRFGPAQDPGAARAAGAMTLAAASLAGAAAVRPLATGSMQLAPAAVLASASSGGGQVGPVWPDPAVVLAGVAYGPTGADYVGTLEPSAGSAGAVAAAVRLELAAELARVVELAQIHGLIAGAPLIVSPNARVAGGIAQIISTANDTTTVTRAQ